MTFGAETIQSLDVEMDYWRRCISRKSKQDHEGIMIEKRTSQKNWLIKTNEAEDPKQRENREDALRTLFINSRSDVIYLPDILTHFTKLKELIN